MKLFTETTLNQVSLNTPRWWEVPKSWLDISRKRNVFSGKITNFEFTFEWLLCFLLLFSYLPLDLSYENLIAISNLKIRPELEQKCDKSSSTIWCSSHFNRGEIDYIRWLLLRTLCNRVVRSSRWVETWEELLSVVVTTDNSPSQDYTHPYDQTTLYT